MAQRAVTDGSSTPGPRDATDLQYARLRQHLVEGRFPPGTLLLETALSVEYGVSRTPMREALGRLAQDGLIERSTRGFQVRTRSPQEVVDVYDARIALESTCASLAAIRRTDFDLVRLTHALPGRGDLRTTTAGQRGSAWHEALRAAAHNQTIVDLLTRLDTLLEIYRTKKKQAPDDQAVADHEAILVAVRDRDPVAAEEAMREHLRRMRDRRIANLLAEGG
jgi:DNA-binding GntR family transcriptional regulator